ncbi:MAG: choice-of-anchor Q domain-containing protein [Thermoleophilia bacterium]
MSRRTRLALTAAALLVAAAPAAAATRHAAPAGTGAAPCTDAAAPCTLDAALTAAQAGDTVLLAGGAYPMDMTGHAPVVPLTVAARPGETPVVRFSGPGATWTATGAGNVIDGVTIANTGTGAALAVAPGAGVVVRRSALEGAVCADLTPASSAAVEDSALSGRVDGICLRLGPTGFLSRSTVRTGGLTRGTPPPAVLTAGVVEDSTVRGGIRLSGPSAVVRRTTAVGGLAPALAGNGTVTDSVAVNLTADGEAVAADGMTDPGAAPALRLSGVTAYAPSGIAVHARSGCADTGPARTSRLEMVDTIARGRTDVAADIGVTCSLGQSAYFGRVSSTFSNWTTRMPAAGALGAEAIETGPGNIAGDPRFTSPGGTDPLAVDLRPLPGSPVVDAGTGTPESLPSDRDLRPRVSGAAQDMGAYELQVPPAVTGGTPPPADTTPPALTVRVRAGAKGRVSIVRAVVDEAATVRVTAARTAPGRIRAGRCVAPSDAPHRAARCTRVFPLRGVAARHGGPGTVSIPLGALNLRPGVYRIAVTAVDDAGNASATVRVPLRVRA